MSDDDKEWQRYVQIAMKLAKTMSHSGDLQGATYKELRAIKREAKRLLP